MGKLTLKVKIIYYQHHKIRTLPDKRIFLLTSKAIFGVNILDSPAFWLHKKFVCSLMKKRLAK